MQSEIDILLISNDRKEAFLINTIMSKVGGFASLALVEDIKEIYEHIDKILDKNYRFPELIIFNVNDDIEASLKVTRQLKENEVIRSVPIILLLNKALEDRTDDFYNYHVNCCIIKKERQEEFEKDMEETWRYWADTARLNCRELI